MFSVDDIRTPRDRVSEEYIQRLLAREEQAKPSPCCCEAAEAAVSPKGRENAHHCRKMDGMPLAMVYSSCQMWRGIYAPDMALRRGTLFKELDKPWEVTRGKGGCGCGK